jgi:membrane-associated phospholipid phosphatase
VAIGSVALGAGLLLLVRAPSELTVVVLAELTGLVVVLVITHFWKISIHAATAGGLLGVFLVLYGPGALLGLIPLALIAWSRTVLGAHTVAQVTVGAATGFAGAVLVFAALR